MVQATFDPGAKIRRWERNLEHPEAALKQIGAMMVAESQRAFKDQRFGKKAWQPRGAINVFGIIADFAAGKKSPPARRFERRPALRDTNALAQSIAFRLVGNDAVEVGSNKDYAGVHKTGGQVESKPITEALQKALWQWLRRQPKPMQDKLGWLLNKHLIGKTLKMKVPARPFIGITKETIANVQEAVAVKLMEVR
jgi:phage gpG-like protein